MVETLILDEQAGASSVKIGRDVAAITVKLPGILEGCSAASDDLARLQAWLIPY